MTRQKFPAVVIPLPRVLSVPKAMARIGVMENVRGAIENKIAWTKRPCARRVLLLLLPTSLPVKRLTWKNVIGVRKRQNAVMLTSTVLERNP